MNILLYSKVLLSNTTKFYMLKELQFSLEVCSLRLVEDLSQ